MMDEEDYLALSGIQHFCFCPRQWGLIHIEQQWEDNTRTFGGTLMHEKADDPFCVESRGAMVISRSMPLISHELRIKGIADVVEFHKVQEDEEGISLKDRVGKWTIQPVEYKYGQPKENNSDLVQLCAQAMCLEEMFNTTIYCGSIYYGKIKHRQKVDFCKNLRDEVKQLIVMMYDYYTEGKTPLEDKTARCKNCSLNNICMAQLRQKRQKIQCYMDVAIREE